jgi:hypothetical protein
MIRLYMAECTQGSLQSEADVRMVRGALGISDKVRDTSAT